MLARLAKPGTSLRASRTFPGHLHGSHAVWPVSILLCTRGAEVSSAAYVGGGLKPSMSTAQQPGVSETCEVESIFLSPRTQHKTQSLVLVEVQGAACAEHWRKLVEDGREPWQMLTLWGFPPPVLI